MSSRVVTREPGPPQADGGGPATHQDRGDGWWEVAASGQDLSDEQRGVLFTRIADLSYELEQSPLFAGKDIVVVGKPSVE
jgi:hypothetical protein